MSSISLDDVKRDLPGFLQRVAAGETIVLLQGNQPVAEVKPVVSASSQPRPYGLCAGEFSVPDDFDAPLPEDILRRFEVA